VEKEYFEDCSIGDRVVTPRRTITETDVVMFSAFTGDWNAVHTDVEYAKTSIFGERIAHGLLTLVIGTGLLFRLSRNDFLPKWIVAIAGMDRVRFIAPVKIGDTIRLEGEIVEMTKISDEQGVLAFKYLVKNQHNRSVMSGRARMISRCRPSEGSAEQKACQDG
jgi:acyl dehydratase